MERTRGESETRSEGGGEVTSSMHMRFGPDPGAPGRTPPDDRGDVPESWTGRARSQVAERVHRIREGVPAPELGRILRAKPLSVLGLAFSAGFFIALTTGARAHANWIERVRRQLKAVVVTGVTAAVVQELRDLIDEEDLDELFSAWADRRSNLEEDAEEV